MMLALRSTRRRLAACAAVAVTACGLLAVPGSAGASAPAVRPVTTGSYYVALGDSVPFGYREAANLPTPNYKIAKNFIGYPENIGAQLKLKVANLACPGETSDSLINSSLPSFGCETKPAGYRTNFPLHDSYGASQLHRAINFIKSHPNTRLVSLMVGANDGFLCQASTTDHCASELLQVLTKVRNNVTTTLSRIRKQAHYTGQIVIVNYYSTDYTDATASGQSQALNQVLDSAGEPYNVTIADGYGAFQRAAAQAGGDTCKAGLLTTLSTGGCGVHPSVAGQALLAGAVERVVK